MKTCILQEIEAYEEQQTLNNPNLHLPKTRLQLPVNLDTKASYKISLFKSATPLQRYTEYNAPTNPLGS